MAIVTGDRYLESLVKFIENQAEKLIDGTIILKLNPVGLRYVQSRLEALAEVESLLAGAPVDYLRAYVSDLGDHRSLEQLRRILRLLSSLKVISVLPPLARDPSPLYLLPFGRLKILELRGCDLSTSAAKGLLELRFTLEKLVCHNSTDALRHVFASSIAEIKDSAQWSRLSFVSCACNSLVLMDESLHLLPVVETLDLSRNKFAKVDNLRKCTKLKHLDLGFNSLRSIASLREVSCQIVKLVLRNNALTMIRGIEYMKSLEGLDLSYNIISNFSEVEILAGLPSLQNLWLDGNPLCCARWFRAQVFSYFSDPEKIKLDDKAISASDFWKRQIILASRQTQPASFGVYALVKDNADLEGIINTKRKRTSRLVSIENDEHSSYVCSDHDSVSRENDSQSKDDKTITDEEADIQDFIERIEFMKKEDSVCWLQEFKEWMNNSLNNDVDDKKFMNIMRNKTKIHEKSERKDEREVSSHISGSVQLSGDESSTFALESETSFADTSTVISAQRYFDRIGEVAKKLFMRHANGHESAIKYWNVNQEETKFINGGSSMSANTGETQFNSHAVSKGNESSAKNIISSPIAIYDILDSHSASANPGSPPQYKEDMLQRRQYLEEEFLQLSAGSFSIASSDSNTSCCEDDSAEISHSMNIIDHSLLDNSSENSLNSLFVGSYQRDAADTYHDSILSLKQNRIHASRPCAEEYFSIVECGEVESSASAQHCSFSYASRDDEAVGETNFLETKRHKRRPKKRMISLPEEEDANGDTDSSKKSDDVLEICQSDIKAERNEMHCSSDLHNSPIAKNVDCTKGSLVEEYYRVNHSGITESSHSKDDFVENFFVENF